MENKILQLEHEIQSLIFKDNGCTVHFEYSVGNCDVSVYTTNPQTKEIFLLKETNKVYLKEDGLKDILKYVKTQKELDSFTVIWIKKDEGTPVKQTSYFYCHDIQDAINKFFIGKDVKDYIIYEVKMNARA